MTDRLAQIQAVAEYVRQRKLLSKDLGPVVHGVFSDPEAEMADLTVDHLDALLAMVREQQAALERVGLVERNLEGAAHWADRRIAADIRAAITATEGEG